MKKNLRFLVGVTAGLVAALGFSSCAYDPYYTTTSVGGAYSSGYGDGYGYGGSSFSTSVFVGTGNPRWGYDPGCYSYYDYSRRCYYDPYLNGYYPVGYRPPVVYGMSHPYGWRPGSGYCQPPGRVTNVTISNYRNRESSYRNYGYLPAGPGRPQPYQQGGIYGQPQNQNIYGRQNAVAQPLQNPYSRQIQGGNPYAQPGRQNSRSGSYPQNIAPPAGRYPARYNSPVTTGQQDFSGVNRSVQGNPQSRQKQLFGRQNQISQIAQPDPARSGYNPRVQQPRQAPQMQPQSQPTAPPKQRAPQRGRQALSDQIQTDPSDPRGQRR